MIHSNNFFREGFKMNLKEQIKTVISETCTHWLISDDKELKKVSKKLEKEFETIINSEIERRKCVAK
jgi:hypothetical protein